MTIKFSKNALEDVKTSKERLIASSGYCAEHWLNVSSRSSTHISGQDLADRPQHSRSSIIKAPKFISPGVTIKHQSIYTAINHIESYATPRLNVADAIELILFARAFRISTLEFMACDHIEKQLERYFKVDGFADAIRGLYEGFSEDRRRDIGDEVVEVVTCVVARVCSRSLAALRLDPAFRMLRRDVSRLTEAILDALAVAEESERYGKQVKAEEQDFVAPQDSPQELLE